MNKSMVRGVLWAVILVACYGTSKACEWPEAKWGSPYSVVLKKLTEKGSFIMEKKTDKICSVEKNGFVTICFFNSKKRLSRVLVSIGVSEGWTPIYQALARTMYAKYGWDSKQKYHEALAVSTDPKVERPTFFLSNKVDLQCFLFWVGSDSSVASISSIWAEELQQFAIILDLCSEEAAPVGVKPTTGDQ